MMYLKQFPDICREMGFDVEDKAKTIRFRSSTFRISITERKRSGRIQISKTNNKKTAHNIIWWAAFLEIYATITNYRIRSEWTVLHI